MCNVHAPSNSIQELAHENAILTRALAKAQAFYVKLMNDQQTEINRLRAELTQLRIQHPSIHA